MKTIKKTDNELVFQGDISMRRVDKLPKGAQESKDNVVAHSETGHHHVAEKALVFSDVDDGETIYLKALGQEVRIVHQRPFDTHEEIALLGKPGQIWEVRRQREWSIAGWRRVED